MRNGDMAMKHLNGRAVNHGGMRFCGRGKVVSIVLSFATAIVAVCAVASTEASHATISKQLPPHGVFGFTYDTNGVTPVPGCIVHVTDLRTGETLVYDSTREFWDPTSNVYSVDLSELQITLPPAIHPWVYGDILNVTAWNPNGLYVGWNESPITDNELGYDQIDVTVDKDHNVIHEFSMVIVPVGGMIALFAVVSLKRRDKEQ